MTSREEFRKYRSASHKQEINIHGGTYSDVPQLPTEASRGKKTREEDTPEKFVEEKK